MKLFLVATFALISSTAFSAAVEDPVVVAQIHNLNDYSLFANGGWDGNWYVGYNNGWIKKLPEIPKGAYARAYIGAKLGRMKTLPPTGKPPQFHPIPGELWMAISSTTTWPSNHRWRLTTTEDIPLDGSAEYALEDVGESEWFWTEIPVEAINFSGDNYVALWSPTPELVAVSSAPVLAAAWGGKDVNTWLAKNLTGEPPKIFRADLTSGISYFQPALALKLVPTGSSHLLQARIVSWQNGTPDHLKPVVMGSVEGESVERVWLEYNGNMSSRPVDGTWKPVGRSVWKTPYMFSLDQAKLPKGKVQLRVAATNIWEERAYSHPVEIEVSPISSKK